MIADDDLAALCIWTEASGEPYEGKVAVGRVIRNRMAAHYSSDGTVAGTVLAPDQFSAFWYSMIAGHYTRISSTLAEAEAHAEALASVAQGDEVWSDCERAWADSAPDSGFSGGPQFQRLTPRTLLYLNPSIVDPLPAWASPEAEVAVIYAHTFYRA